MGVAFILPPPAAVSRILAKFDRAELEGFITVAIDLLDMADGDPDLGDNGDELDGNSAEDDWWHHTTNGQHGPGCPIGDPDAEHDGREPEEYV